MSIIIAANAAATTLPATTAPAAPEAPAYLLTPLLAVTVPLSLALIYRHRGSATTFRPPPAPGSALSLFFTLLLTVGLWVFSAVSFNSLAQSLPISADLRPHLVNLLSTLTGIGAALILSSRPFSLGAPNSVLSTSLHPSLLPRGLTGGASAFLITLPWILLANLAVERLLHRFHITAPHEHQVFTDWSSAAHSPAFPYVVTLTATLAAPFLEELLFRLLLQSTLLSALTSRRPSDSALGARHSALPTLLSILLTTICFTAIHQPWTIQPAIFLLSLALGFAYERDGNLWRPITLHALFNAFNILLFLTTR